MGNLVYRLQKAGYDAKACPPPAGPVPCTYPVPNGCHHSASITIGDRPYCGAHARVILTNGLDAVYRAEQPTRDRHTLADLEARYDRLTPADIESLAGRLLACRIDEIRYRLGLPLCFA